MQSGLVAKSERKKSSEATKSYSPGDAEPQFSAGASAGLPLFLTTDAAASIRTKLTIDRPDDQYEQEADRIADWVMRKPAAGSSAPGNIESHFSGGPAAGLPLFLMTDAGARLQAKLTVNQPGDRYEQEADRVADRVMRMPAPEVVRRPATSDGEPLIRRKCSCGGTCEKCQMEQGRRRLQMKATGAGQAGGAMAPPIVNEALRSPGRPLDAETRAFAEPRFGHDLSGVRVHTDVRAAHSARRINARAYTLGHDIVFGEGEFAPSTQSGRRLLAHELTHVLQQAGSASHSTAEANQVQRDHEDDMANLVAWQIDQNAWNAPYPYPYSYVYIREQIDKVGRRNEDNVSAAFLELQFNAGRLDQFAESAEGRRTLDVLYDAVITGDVSDFERQQADRILDVKARHPLPANRAAAPSGRDPLVFPIARYHAKLSAELLSNGKVRVSYDDSVFDDDFRVEAGTLLSRHSKDEILNGFDLDPDEKVGVKLFGLDNGPGSSVPAIMLIDFANREDKGALWSWNAEDQNDRMAAPVALSISNDAWNQANPYIYIREVFESASSGILSSYAEDNVAAAFISLQSQAGRLDDFAADPEGRRALNVLYAALITGKVTDFEGEQIRKILEALGRHRPAPGAATIKKLDEPMVFPVADQHFFGSAGSGATLHAAVVANGRIRVYYDTSGVKAFGPEYNTLLRRHTEGEIIGGGFELDPDELVGAKLYEEEDEPLVYVPALMLIDFSNRLDQAFWGRFKEVSALAAGAGAGGLISGVGALATADRVATVIAAASAIINDYRHEIMKSSGGRIFLSVWKYVDAAAQYYGLGRLGFDGIRAVKGRLKPALEDWQSQAQPELNSLEQQKITAAQDAAGEWLKAADRAETEAAERYIDEHPLGEVQGTEPGKRHAKTGEHEMEEVVTSDGIICELHSPGWTRVRCREGMGTAATEQNEGEPVASEAGQSSAGKSAKDPGKDRQVVTVPEKPPKPIDPPIGTRSGPISPAEDRIRIISGKKNIYVGVRVKIRMKQGAAITEGLRSTEFVKLDKSRAAAIGGEGSAAVLPDVTVPKHAGAKAGSQRSAGFVIKPAPGADSLEVVAWNTGQPLKESNISHAEAQFIEWFRGQDPKWTGQVESVEVEVFGKDICMYCDADIQDLQRGYENVKFKWNRRDTGHPYKPPKPAK